MKFVKVEGYYTGTVYEFNLPTGYSCPFALECKVFVHRYRGKFIHRKGAFHCYAAFAERFPGVRKHRWNNFIETQNGGVPDLPEGAKAIRIHGSGDFYSQDYFDMWLDLIRKNPDIEFWAFTKSIPYWLKRLSKIPDNLILTASFGGMYDNLIYKFKLKSARVIKSPEEAGGLPIDTNDNFARIPDVHFVLVDNRVKYEI